MQQLERLSQPAATANTLYSGTLQIQNAGCRTIPTVHVHNGNKRVQVLKTVVSLVYMCMQPSLYLCRAGGILSPGYLLLQAANLLLQVTDCLTASCCLCSQLRLQFELTSSENSIEHTKLQRPSSTSKHLCKTRLLMLLQYTHG